MNREKTVIAVIVSSSLCLAQLTATGAATAPAPTPERLVQLARQAKVVDSGHPIDAVLNGTEADIRTDCGAEDTEKDLKIDAVLIAKSILTACKGEIGRVKVTFKWQGQNARELVVTEGDVLAFGSGQMSEKDLFSSIAITEVGQSRQTKKPATPAMARVAAGPLWFERYSVLRQIDALKDTGADVKPLQELFDKAQLHALAKDTDATRQDLQVLQEKLSLLSDMPHQRGFPQTQQPMAPWFEMARFQVQNKIRQLKSLGQDTSEYHQEMLHVNRLVQEQRMGEASELLKRMQSELGFLKSDQ